MLLEYIEQNKEAFITLDGCLPDRPGYYSNFIGRNAYTCYTGLLVIFAFWTGSQKKLWSGNVGLVCCIIWSLCLIAALAIFIGEATYPLISEADSDTPEKYTVSEKLRYPAAIGRLLPPVSSPFLCMSAVAGIANRLPRTSLASAVLLIFSFAAAWLQRKKIRTSYGEFVSKGRLFISILQKDMDALNACIEKCGKDAKIYGCGDSIAVISGTGDINIITADTVFEKSLYWKYEEHLENDGLQISRDPYLLYLTLTDPASGCGEKELSEIYSAVKDIFSGTENSEKK